MTAKKLTKSKSSRQVQAVLTTLSVGILSLIGTNANAIVVDNSQQKTIYIGKGNAQNMQAVKVTQVSSPKPITSLSNNTQTANTVTTLPQQQAYSTANKPVATSVSNSQVAATITSLNSAGSTSFSGSYGTPSTGSYASSYGDQLPISTKSAAAMVFDLQTGKPIYQKNADTVRSIASITKVMTAMVLLDAGLDMREEIVIEESDLKGAKKASSNLKAGDRMSRSEFILLMLMKSENPAAKALARTYPGGYDAFISAMNQKAASLGMTQTSYSDSSGLDPRNRSTANDLVRMLRVVNADPRYQTIRNFSTAPSYDFYINNYSLGARTYKANNTSRLVRAGSHPIGVSKTGFISEAGYCYVMETHVNNRPAIVVLLGAGTTNSRWNDAEDILTQLAYRN